MKYTPLINPHDVDFSVIAYRISHEYGINTPTDADNRLKDKRNKFVKDLVQRIADLERLIFKLIKDINYLHMNPSIRNCKAKLIDLVNSLKFAKRDYIECERLLKRIIAEPWNEELVNMSK